MSWPKHNWGWIVIGRHGPFAENGQGMFTTAGHAEVFLDRKTAEWVKNKEQKFLREFGAIQRAANRRYYEESVSLVKIIRIALPGTYPQFQIPGKLERELKKKATVQ
jgi:hypothetical protein